MTKMRFLCTNHINWLRAHPSEIPSALNNAIELGIYYQDRNMWSEAIAPLGNSYELSALLLEIQHSLDFKKTVSGHKKEQVQILDRKQHTEQAFLWFADSAKRFVFALIQTDHDALAADTIDQTRYLFRRLEKHCDLISAREISELIRTLKVIRFSETDTSIQIQSKLLPIRPLETLLTLQ